MKKQMKLNVLERSHALTLLPEQGNFVTLKAVHEARLTLALSESERTEFITKNADGLDVWTEKALEMRDLDLNKTAQDIIREKLEELDSKKELKAEQMSLYEKFVEQE